MLNDLLIIRYDTHKGLGGANTALLSVQSFSTTDTPPRATAKRAERLLKEYESQGHTAVAMYHVIPDHSVIEALSEMSPDLSLTEQLTERGLEHTTLTDLLAAAKYAKYC